MNLIHICQRPQTISLLLSAILVSPLDAVPGITGVTGVMEHGSIVIISGTGFGTKSPVEPYFYDNFEAQTPGQSILGKPGAVGSALWKLYDGGTHADNLYSAEGYRGQSVKRLSRMNCFTDGYIDGINAQQAYVTYRYKYTHTGSWTGSYSSVNKVFRMASLEGSNPIYSGQPALMMTYMPSAEWLFALLSTDGTAAGSKQTTISGIPDENTWYRLEGFLKLSSPAGEANGEYFAGTLNNHASGTVMVTRAAGYNSLINSFLLPFTSANGGEAPTDTFTQWADDVYFDNTQARVELCDAPQWSSSTKRCEIQIPRVTWADNSIQIQVNLGAFQSGQTAYLYVIDSAGHVNNSGYPVTISGQSDPNHAPSLTPIGNRIIPAGEQLQLTIEATDSDGDELQYGATGG